MKFIVSVLAAASCCSCFVTTEFSDATPTGWYFLRYTIPIDTQFTSLSGEMVIPPLMPANGGTYYLWPGLQVEDWDGIYQNVLGGNDSGAWTLWSGYCCENPVVTWSDSFDTYEGHTVRFNNVRSGDTWTTTSTEMQTGMEVTTEFDPLVTKEFGSAVFAIELFDTAWDFGSLTFKNIIITATGTDATWCNGKPENWKNATDFTVLDVTSSIDDTGITCNIGSLVLNQPRASMERPTPRASSPTTMMVANATVTSIAAGIPTSTGTSNATVLFIWKIWALLVGLLLVVCNL